MKDNKVVCQTSNFETETHVNTFISGVNKIGEYIPWAEGISRECTLLFYLRNRGYTEFLLKNPEASIYLHIPSSTPLTFICDIYIRNKKTQENITLNIF